MKYLRLLVFVIVGAFFGSVLLPIVLMVFWLALFANFDLSTALASEYTVITSAFFCLVGIFIGAFEAFKQNNWDY